VPLALEDRSEIAQVECLPRSIPHRSIDGDRLLEEEPCCGIIALLSGDEPKVVQGPGNSLSVAKLAPKRKALFVTSTRRDVVGLVEREIASAV
jgi:hypothetical protein